MAILIVTCFGGVLFRDQQFAFRDAAHFYYPLYYRVQQEWAAGRLPLWEPGENGGMPLLGSPMAAVLYPGKIIFALVPYAWGMRLYVVAHVVLAFGATLVLARSWGLSPTAAMLAGLCYAFSGPVLSNHFNVIYLVGAAWTPLGFRAADGWLRLRRHFALIELALVLAMQILGGDAEAAYITLVCAFGYAFALASRGQMRAMPLWACSMGLLLIVISWAWIGPSLASRIHGSGRGKGQTILALVWLVGSVAYVASREPKYRSRLGAMLLGLVGSALLAVLVAAVQVIPVLEQTATSIRWAGTDPIYLYDSSLLPYRTVEWVWPNVFGTFTTGNRYWMSLLPPAGAQRPLPLSLYTGALPLVLALGAASFRNGSAWRAWMSAVAVLSLLISFGEFTGPSGWMGGEPTPTGGDDSFCGFLTTILPGLRLFRLPYKLLVFTSLALSTLAGVGWDRLAAGEGHRRTTAIATGLVILTLPLLLTIVSQREQCIAMFAAVPHSEHSVFGPLDAQGAVADILRGLGHGAAALTLSFVYIVTFRRWTGWTRLAVLPLLAIDLALANAPTVLTIPQRDFQRRSEVAQAIAAAEGTKPTPGPFRVHRLASWVPAGWSRVASPQRLREAVNWEIDTLQPGFGLLYSTSYVLADESETGRAGYARFFHPSFRVADNKAAAALGVEPGQRVLYYPRQAFDIWGTRYFILPSFPAGWSTANRSYAALLDQTDMIYPDPATLQGPAHKDEREHWLEFKDVQVRRNNTAFPRAWIVHEARLVQPLETLPSAARNALYARLGFRDGPRRDDSPLPAPDLRALTYLETDHPEILTSYSSGGLPDSTESVRVCYHSPTSVEITVHLQRPGFVVLADAFDRGWQLMIDGRPAPILCANLFMRAAAVMPGAHTLAYTYAPLPVQIGTWVSLGSTLVLLGLARWARARAAA